MLSSFRRVLVVCGFISLGTSGWADYLGEWTFRTNLPLKRVIYSGGMFVGVGPAGRVLTSRDGALWAAQNSQTQGELYGIAHRPPPSSMFVAVGDNIIIHSVDATNWTATASPWLLRDVTYAGFRFVIVTAQISMSEPNVLYGTPSLPPLGGWMLTPRTFTAASASFQRVAYGNGIHVAVADIYSGIWTSSNLLSWANHAVGSQYFQGVAFGNGRFVAAGLEGSPYVSTDNGVTWNRFYVNPEAGHFADDNYYVAEGMAFGDGKFAIFRGWRSNMFWSVNGSNWVVRPVPSGDFITGAFGKGTLVAVGPAGIWQSGSYAPALTARRAALDQPVEVSFLAETGRTYGIEASTNFTQWNEVFRTTNTTSSVRYLDWSATNSSRRFYRGVTP